MLKGQSLVNDATALVALGFALPRRKACWACSWALFRGNRSWLRSCLGPPDGARLAGGSPKAGETELALSEKLFVQVGR